MNVQKMQKSGLRRGEDHHRSELTSHEVELMRQMYAAGGWTYDTLAVTFECSKSCVQGIITERRRIYG